MIFYFSGTGNTRWAARQLAEATHEELVFIPEAQVQPHPYSLAPDERIGFCFPVHGWRPPTIVRRFIENLQISNAEGHYCYAVCTCGDDIGRCTRVLRKSLAAAGLQAHSVFSLTMPESYVCLPGFGTDPEEKGRAKIAKAEADLQRYAEMIVRRERGHELTVNGWLPWTKTYLLGSYFNRFMITDKPFSVNAEACLRCGRCAKACSVGNIQWEPRALPRWKRDGSCTNCLACYHHCPKHAIAYGKQTQHKGQYYFGIY